MEKELKLKTHDEALELFGNQDQNLRLIRDTLGVKVVVRNHTIRLTGEEAEVEAGVEALSDLLERIRRGDGDRSLRLAAPVAEPPPEAEESGCFRFQTLREPVTPRSPGQLTYLQAIEGNDVVLCIGPAGTGKTYLAVAMGVASLRQGTFKKIVMVRPAVEAGEKLGFLPGDFQAKVNPYLKPIYDALSDFFDYKQLERYVEREIFEIVPLAYMRGRTLNNSFIILDEAQNTTVAQMKMLLTRLGIRSKAVITGDITQIDLPPETESGLVHAAATLARIKGLAVVEMTEKDIVRHGLVKKIVDAYRRAEAQADAEPQGGE